MTAAIFDDSSFDQESEMSVIYKDSNGYQNPKEMAPKESRKNSSENDDKDLAQLIIKEKLNAFKKELQDQVLVFIMDGLKKASEGVKVF